MWAGVRGKGECGQVCEEKGSVGRFMRVGRCVKGKGSVGRCVREGEVLAGV